TGRAPTSLSTDSKQPGAFRLPVFCRGGVTMRGMHKFLVTVGVTVAAVGLALAQGGGGGGFGFGFGKGGNTNPVTLINREDVKKELKLTDEQLAKVPDALWTALGNVLTP